MAEVVLVGPELDTSARKLNSQARWSHSRFRHATREASSTPPRERTPLLPWTASSTATRVRRGVVMGGPPRGDARKGNGFSPGKHLIGQLPITRRRFTWPMDDGFPLRLKIFVIFGLQSCKQTENDPSLAGCTVQHALSSTLSTQPG
jgi:hypothetical protein